MRSMHILHNIQHEGGRSVCACVWGGMFVCGRTWIYSHYREGNHRSVSSQLRPPDNTNDVHHKRGEDTRQNEGLGRRGVTEIHYVVPTSFISTRSRDGAPGVPALDQRAPSFSPLLCESVLRCEPGPKRRSINVYRGWTTARSQAPETRSP